MFRHQFSTAANAKQPVSSVTPFTVIIRRPWVANASRSAIAMRETQLQKIANWSRRLSILSSLEVDKKRVIYCVSFRLLN